MIKNQYSFGNKDTLVKFYTVIMGDNNYDGINKGVQKITDAFSLLLSHDPVMIGQVGLHPINFFLFETTCVSRISQKLKILIKIFYEEYLVFFVNIKLN